MKESQSDPQLEAGFAKPIGCYAFALFARDEHAGPVFLYNTGGQLLGRISLLPELHLKQHCHLQQLDGMELLNWLIGRQPSLT
jgi:hypothetical protein